MSTPVQTTLLYSRVNGYLHSWKADIGDRVRRGRGAGGDRHARNWIRSWPRPRPTWSRPASTWRYLQARNWRKRRRPWGRPKRKSPRPKPTAITPGWCTSGTSNCTPSRRFPARTWRRAAAIWTPARRNWTRPRPKLKTRQVHGGTTRTAHIRSHEATVNSLEANVRRLKQLQGFKIIQAPFDGRRHPPPGRDRRTGERRQRLGSHELFALAQADIAADPHQRAAVPGPGGPGRPGRPRSWCPSIRTGRSRPRWPARPGRSIRRRGR